MPRQQNTLETTLNGSREVFYLILKLKCEFCSVLKFEKIFQIQRLLCGMNLTLLIDKSRTPAEQARTSH